MLEAQCASWASLLSVILRTKNVEFERNASQMRKSKKIKARLVKESICLMVRWLLHTPSDGHGLRQVQWWQTIANDAQKNIQQNLVSYEESSLMKKMPLLGKRFDEQQLYHWASWDSLHWGPLPFLVGGYPITARATLQMSADSSFSWYFWW